MQFRCPNCNIGIKFDDHATELEKTVDVIVCPSCNSKFDFSGDETETHFASVGQKIGHFEIQKALGEGTFGTVYSAFDTRLERSVAIKVPRPGRLRNQLLKAFFKEARAASTIRHPNVVQVFEIGTHEDVPYIVSELIEGVSLSHWLKDNDLTHRHAAELMQTVCEAVEAAHAQGVVHRDLKPGNILMDADGQPHVADFGLARRSGTSDITVAKQGDVFGTPSYMSPEQARGDIRKIDAVSDVYSLGVCLYQMLSGKRPFRAKDSQTVIHQILCEEPAALRVANPSIPADLETICLCAMDKNRERRYQSAGELAEELQRFLDGRPIKAKPISRIERGIRWARRNPRFAAVALIAVVFACCSMALFLRPPAEATRQTMNTIIACELPDGVSPSATIQSQMSRLDEDRNPDRAETVHVPDGGTQVTVDLLPGEFLIVVDAVGIGFHEVYRLVPSSTDSISGSYTPTAFTFQDESVVLPPVRIFREADVVEEMALVAGGEYAAGQKGNPFSPLTQFQIADFYLQKTEVTYDDYTQTNNIPAPYKNASPPPTKSHPIVGVNLYQATHYAETIGCRLMTELEWEFAATNGGTTDFPWVGNHSPEPRWILQPVGTPDFDVTPETGIRGLYTNASEMTSSPLRPFGDGVIREEAANLASDSYIYKGGPSDRQTAKTGNAVPVKSRMSLQNRNAMGDFLSFRCARSAKPLKLRSLDE